LIYGGLSASEVLSFFRLHVNQAAVSKMERRADMYITTLQRVIKAMGGRLEIRAVFANSVVRISQFQDLRKRA
jgi:hypothetical protein